MTETICNTTENQNYYNEEGGESGLSTTERYFDDLRDQFAALPMAIFEDVRSDKLKHRDVCLFAHLLCKQGTRPSSYWGIDSLAELTGTHATGVKDSLRRLVSTGHIARIPSTNTTHTVCLTRLDPRKNSNRILIKTQALAEPTRKRYANKARSKRRNAVAPSDLASDSAAIPPRHKIGMSFNDEMDLITAEYSTYDPADF